jgi:hypothetical protein
MVIVSKKEVKEEPEHSLFEWGIGLTEKQNAKAHEHFRMKVIQAGTSMRSKKWAKPLKFDALKSDIFTEDLSAAYKHVLQNENVSEPMYAYSDSIEAKGGPFHRYYNRRHPRQSKKVIWYQRKQVFKGLPLDSLDPLRRFDFEPISKEELFFRAWFVKGSSGSKIAKPGDLLMESALTCRAIHHEPCFSCKYRNTLRWNGGDRMSWQNLVCTHCDCMYDIQTKEDMDNVEKYLSFNSFPGGSFLSSCMLHYSKRPGQKMFLVLLPRRATLNRKSQHVYPVQVAEMERSFQGYYISRRSTQIMNLFASNPRLLSTCIPRNIGLSFPACPSYNCKRSPKKSSSIASLKKHLTPSVNCTSNLKRDKKIALKTPSIKHQRHPIVTNRRQALSISCQTGRSSLTIGRICFHKALNN